MGRGGHGIRGDTGRGTGRHRDMGDKAGDTSTPPPPGYSVAVGEFSGDTTQGGCHQGATGRVTWWGGVVVVTAPRPPTWAPPDSVTLSLADFVAGVPKGNLTYGYVRLGGQGTWGDMGDRGWGDTGGAPWGGFPGCCHSVPPSSVSPGHHPQWHQHEVPVQLLRGAGGAGKGGSWGGGGAGGVQAVLGCPPGVLGALTGCLGARGAGGGGGPTEGGGHPCMVGVSSAGWGSPLQGGGHQCRVGGTSAWWEHPQRLGEFYAGWGGRGGAPMQGGGPHPAPPPAPRSPPPSDGSVFRLRGGSHRREQRRVSAPHPNQPVWVLLPGTHGCPPYSPPPPWGSAGCGGGGLTSAARRLADLLVGAPLFMARTGEGRVQEVGRVYLYLQLPGGGPAHPRHGTHPRHGPHRTPRIRALRQRHRPPGRPGPGRLQRWVLRAGGAQGGVSGL